MRVCAMTQEIKNNYCKPKQVWYCDPRSEAQRRRQKNKYINQMNIKFTKADAETYINTTDKAVFIVDLLNLFSIDQLTPEIEDEVEAQLLALL